MVELLVILSLALIITGGWLFIRWVRLDSRPPPSNPLEAKLKQEIDATFIATDVRRNEHEP